MPMKLIILDRDGVINVDSDQFIKSPDEWKPIPGALEAIAPTYLRPGMRDPVLMRRRLSGRL